MSKKAVLFDLDGTLLDRETSVRALIRDQYQRLEPRLGSAGMERYLSEFSRFDRRGYAAKPVVYEQMRTTLGLGVGADELTEDYFAHYGDFSVGFEGVEETLGQLRDRGVRTGIITNGTVRLQSAAIDALGIAELVDIVVISEALGIRKPDRAIFQAALDGVGVDARDSWFVGDHPETDVRGAQRAGMRAIWRRDDYWGKCDFADGIIDQLGELSGYIA